MISRIDKNIKVPAYRQIADQIEKLIDDGTFTEGTCLPAERKMCVLTGAGRNTVKYAYEELARRGLVVTKSGSGSYIKFRDKTTEKRKAEKTVEIAMQYFRDAGFALHETEHLFKEYIWNHLPEDEKVRIAWVDCSVEILRDVEAEIELFCNARVTSLLLDDVFANWKLLSEGNYDVMATTINHYDEIRQWMEKKGEPPLKCDMEMVILTVSRMTVSQMAQIEQDMQVLVVYESEDYRYSIECYLKEFSVKGKIRYVNLSDIVTYLIDNTEKAAVILPQDFSFRGGKVKEIYLYCAERDIFCFAFQQVIDSGSMIHLKKQIQEQWVRKAEKIG